MIRATLDDDLRFVRSAWLQSYATSDWARLVTPSGAWEQKHRGGQVYFDSQRATIELCIASSVVLVHETEGLLDGFVCGWPGAVLHYVFVKWSRRGKGIARALLDALDLRDGAPIVYTHRALGARGNPRGWAFDPSPHRFIREIHMSDMRRVKFAYFGDHRSISLRKGGTSGQKNMAEFFRAEEDKVVAHLNEQTGLMYIKDTDHGHMSIEHVVSVHGCKDVVLYAPGEIPQWEKDERAAKAKATEDAKALSGLAVQTAASVHAQAAQLKAKQ